MTTAALLHLHNRVMPAPKVEDPAKQPETAPQELPRTIDGVQITSGPVKGKNSEFKRAAYDIGKGVYRIDR